MGKLARILGVSGALAGVVLATATSASAHSSAPSARVPVVRVSAAGQGQPVAKGITAIHARPAVSLAKPGGYTLVESDADHPQRRQPGVRVSQLPEEERRADGSVEWRSGDQLQRPRGQHQLLVSIFRRQELGG